MYEVKMPKLSDSMETGKIIRWKVKEGDRVHEGDVLAEVESDKAVMDLECFSNGVMSRILRGDDSEVLVGETIARIDDQAKAPAGVAGTVSAAGGPKAFQRAAVTPEAPKAEAVIPSAPVRPEGPVRETNVASPMMAERAAISPYARKLAAERGIDCTTIRGTGPGGRIVARDVRAVVPAGTEMKGERRSPARAAVEGPAPGADEPKAPPSPDEELPPIAVTPDEADVEEAPFRLRTQARLVTASKHVVPHFYMMGGVDVTRLMKMKDEAKEKFGATVTHLIMAGVLKTLKQHPEVNRSYDRGKIIKWKVLNLGLAVDTDKGLTVAVLRNAGAMDLAEIVRRTAELVARAKGDKLSVEERRHPTFTITNLGMFDVESFIPIINPPSSMILAVSSALDKVVVRGGAFFPATIMNLTLTCDHRIIDGATAARFLKDLRSSLENPEAFLQRPQCRV